MNHTHTSNVQIHIVIQNVVSVATEVESIKLKEC